ncbi:hypothetical protein ADK67_32655 [Saccharothrix sp. NRRL B-16348]|uniref:SRPBCC family protein n=1 Tax=Saccharothrix sp. NRRL B-16348 TaxID=1415542 RepID=UPI0006AE676F|nr:SRPBCC family protein [Saccharothrix sp. NRRL B-16348]KOX19698.1 hypothetical protein ADK67_32655 [Saccharothrix sp. NRRL B-16348]
MTLHEPTTREPTPNRGAETAVRVPARTTRTRTMPADAEVVFDIVTDLEHLDSWLPTGAEVELYGPGLLRLWPFDGADDEPCERRVRIDWGHLKVQWGGDEATTYTGVLRVLRMTPGRSAVAVDLTGPAHLPQPLLDSWLARALDALATVVGAERPTTAWPGVPAGGQRHEHGLAATSST